MDKPFISAHSKSRVVKILLIAGAIVSGLSLLSGALSLIFPPLTDGQEIGDNPVGFAIALIDLGLALLTLLIYFATVVFFLLWLYRSCDNLRAFGARHLNYSPGWAVGSFFVPFANLVVPYRAVKEVWQNSVPPGETFLSVPTPPAWFPTWWAFWLFSSWAGNISLRLSFNENVAESTATIVSMIADALSIVAALFAFVVVDEIDQRQEETRETLRLGRFPGPPAPPAQLGALDVPSTY